MVSIASDSRATDASLRALADAATAVGGDAAWLIVGGHMVNLHVLQTAVGVPLRVTRDADLAVELVTIRDGDLVQRLRALGYDNKARANRFDRIRAGLVASIDVLVPSYTNRHVANMDAGDIAVDGLPVLHAALASPPVVVALEAELTDGQAIRAAIRIPAVVSAIAMKVLAYAQRFAPRDAEDVVRLLEVAHADGVEGSLWPSGTTFQTAGRRLSELFDKPGRALDVVGGSPAARVRVRAMVRSIVGRP